MVELTYDEVQKIFEGEEVKGVRLSMSGWWDSFGWVYSEPDRHIYSMYD